MCSATDCINMARSELQQQLGCCWKCQTKAAINSHPNHKKDSVLVLMENDGTVASHGDFLEEHALDILPLRILVWGDRAGTRHVRFEVCSIDVLSIVERAMLARQLYGMMRIFVHEARFRGSRE